MRVTILWQTFDSGLYSNHEFDLLYKNVGHNNGNLAFVYAIQSQIDADITFAVSVENSGGWHWDWGAS